MTAVWSSCCHTALRYDTADCYCCCVMISMCNKMLSQLYLWPTGVWSPDDLWDLMKAHISVYRWATTASLALCTVWMDSMSQSSTSQTTSTASTVRLYRENPNCSSSRLAEEVANLTKRAVEWLLWKYSIGNLKKSLCLFLRWKRHRLWGVPGWGWTIRRWSRWSDGRHSHVIQQRLSEHVRRAGRQSHAPDPERHSGVLLHFPWCVCGAFTHLCSFWLITQSFRRSMSCMSS